MRLPRLEIRRSKCKHIFAAEFTFEQDFLSELASEEAVIPQPYLPPRKTYSQDWVSYDKAQKCEKSEFQFLLAELCKGIGEPSQIFGRPRLPLEDMIFSCVFKVYSRLFQVVDSTPIWAKQRKKDSFQKRRITQALHDTSQMKCSLHIWKCL